jgi:hypothetical protein
MCTTRSLLGPGNHMVGVKPMWRATNVVSLFDLKPTKYTKMAFYNIANDSMSNGELLGLGYTTCDNFCKIAKLGHVTKYGHVAQLIH